MHFVAPIFEDIVFVLPIILAVVTAKSYPS
jgi:hypothetical protein